jgi:acetyl-CoA carboxylase biotin carboxylase subunit
MPISKLLIANRGEIALRILRSCRELGIPTVAVYSTVDRNALHVQLADEAVCVGEAPSSKSYLNIPNIIAAATSRGADAIHPGYGFLAENDRFAEICADHGITFVGPSPESIRSMGDKSTAKATMQRVGVPTIPGSEGLMESVAQARALADSMGYPVMIKATAGGGGRGMRLVPSADQLNSLFKAAQGEAEAAFGNPGLYMEKFIDRPRHVEVQVLADRHGNVVHVGERDCSIQRRHQKLLEEGAGTVEFLVDRSGAFYFMEMNTRIQVEHPVTEMVTGVDLIAEQLRIAGGEPISVNQDQIQMRGHAIEVRINAEDPRQNFRPAPGKITGWLPPGGPGVRFDSHVYTGYEIPPFYDSLIGKLIVWGNDREHALRRLRRALSECAVTGIPTTIEFHLQLLDRPEFQAGNVHTKFVEQEMLPSQGS